MSQFCQTFEPVPGGVSHSPSPVFNSQGPECLAANSNGNITKLKAKGWHIEKTYDYHDATGTLLYQNVRLERRSRNGAGTEKTFRQRRPHPSGNGRIENLNGVGRVPYNLPELTRRSSEDIHITEGEKDAETLKQLGLLSTSVAVPNSTELDVFRDRHVLIYEDNDDAGRRKAQKLAKALGRITKSVRIVSFEDAGPGGDVTDWIHQGHTFEDLLIRIEEAPNASNPTKGKRTRGNSTQLQHTYISRRAADIKPEPIGWLWRQRIACGKLGLMAGQPGLGKSQLSIHMASRISVGGRWPDGAVCPQGSVILISCEDDAADTIVPRLQAADANLECIHLLDWVVNDSSDGDSSPQLFDISQHILALHDMIESIGDVRLVIIDPISAYTGAVDSHKTSDVRGALAPLQQLAGETGAAVLLVSHLNKGSADANAMARVSGSGAFVAACRSAWLVESDPKDDTNERRIFTPLKNNIGDDRTGFAYRTQGVTLPSSIETSRVEFEPNPVTISASELLSGQQENDAESSTLSEAVDFLRQYLASGPKGALSTVKAGKEAAISERTLRRAKKQLNAKSKKSKVTSQWLWALPENSQDGQDGQGYCTGQDAASNQDGQVSPFENGGHLGHVGHLGKRQDVALPKDNQGSGDQISDSRTS